MIEYLSTVDIAGWFGVTSQAVNNWLTRHRDFPAADAVTGKNVKGRMYGWLPEREAEIRAWHANRPPAGTRTDLRKDTP